MYFIHRTMQNNYETNKYFDIRGNLESTFIGMAKKKKKEYIPDLKIGMQLLNLNLGEFSPENDFKKV